MPLRPDGTRLLVIRSADGEVLYEGDGQVQVGMDPAAIPGVDGPRTDRESARGLVLHVDTDTDEQEDGRTWGDMVRSLHETRERALEIGSAIRHLLTAYGLGPETRAPSSPAARAYWELLDETARQVEPDIETVQSWTDRARIDMDDVPGFPQVELDPFEGRRPASLHPYGSLHPYWGARWRRLYEGGFIRASEAAAEFEQAVTGPPPEHDELIEATRSEFPYDPLDYGRFGREEMAWSPPEDGQEVPRCP